MRSLTLSKLALGLFALVSAAPVALSAVSVALPAPIDDLKSHPVIKTLQLEEVSPVRTLNIYVEVMPGADFDRPDVVAQEIAGVFNKVEAEFDRQFPGLNKRERINLVVTNHPDTWLSVRGERPSTMGADFLDCVGKHGTVVTYDLAWPGASRASRETGLRFAMAQALLASAAKVEANQLPGALVLGAGHLLSTSDPLEPAGDLSTRLSQTLFEGGFQDQFLMGLEPLIRFAGFDELWAHAQSVTSEIYERDAWAGKRLEAYADLMAYGMATAMADASARAALDAWIAGALKGPADAPPGELEQALWTQLLNATRGLDPSLDPRPLGGSSGFKAAVDALALPAKATGSGSANAENAIAEGLYLASTGQLARSLDVLQTASMDARAQRMAAGVEALRDLRRGYLEFLATSPDDNKLRIDWQGRLLVANVTRVGLRSVYLGENIREVEALAIAELPMAGLVERMEKESPVYGAAEARAWAVALIGGNWERSLDADAKNNADLMADLGSVAKQLERGRVLSLISRARDAAGQTANARLDALTELCATAKESDDFVQAQDELRSIASTILLDRFENTDLTELLTASSVKREGDRFELDYDFSDAKQLGDWPELDGYAPEWIKLFEALDEDTPMLKVEKGELQLAGHVTLQHILAFRGPIKVSFEFEIPKQGTKKDSKKVMQDHVYVSICDDLAFQHVRARRFGQLDIVDTDSQTNSFFQYEKPITYKMGKTYSFELSLDENGQVETLFDGKEGFKSEAPGRKEGRMVLMSFSDREVRLSKLHIEGLLGSDQGPLRDVWLGSQLSALGF
jgi:hypothetical protein